MLDRDGVASSLRDAPRWDRYVIGEPRLIGLGPDAVALVFVGQAWRGQESFSAWMTSVYVKTGQDLRLVLYQQTRVA